MIHFSLFSGIGGFDLASEWMGWRNMLSCDINSFCNKILQYYWPNAYHHEDIHTLSYKVINEHLSTRYEVNWRTDDIILTGGFPCQPYSAAGKRLGKEDDRHLWPEMLRIIREVQPTWVVGENVYGIINWNEGLVFDEVQADLEAEGYEVQPYVLPAVAVNAPHRRDRVWFVAHKYGAGLQAQGAELETAGIEQYRKLGGLTSHSKSERSRQFTSKNQRQQDRRFDNNGTIQYASNTSIKRCNNGSNNREERYIQNYIGSSKKNKSKWKGRKRGSCEISTIDSNTSSQRLQGSQNKGITQRMRSISEQQPSRFFCTNWQNFPTQSPICGGDDGLPTELDGITFSKWRNESIKGYGNAIVPQVALQIFKAIQQWEDQVYIPKN